MKLTKAICREAKVFNEHNYADGNPYITYCPQQIERWSSSASWSICHPKYWLDKKNWRRGGKLEFNIWTPSNKEEKEAKLVAAKIIFIELFGKTEFVKTPFGSLMPKEFVEQRNKEIINLIFNKKD